MPNSNPQIVVGVVSGTAAAVVEAAAGLAEHIGAELVCANVDASSEKVEEKPDGTVVSRPIDPDVPFEENEEFDAGLRRDRRSAGPAAGALVGAGAGRGGPAQELAGLAERLDAALIVVGTRESGFRGSVEEFLNGSVDIRLAHRQHRPVVMIPLHPVLDDADLPWKRAQ